MRELVEERLAVDAAPAGREEDGEVEVEDVAGEWATSFRTEGSEGRGKGEGEGGGERMDRRKGKRRGE